MASEPRKSANLPYEEGTWFAVPLEGGGYATGVVARMAPQGRVLLGYFFGPRTEDVPALESIQGIGGQQASLVARFGDLGLIQGQWPVIGRSPNWQRSSWPVPVFGRVNPVDQRGWQVIYPDADPSGRPHETEVETPAAERLPGAGLFGAGAIEAMLSRRLPPLARSA